MIGFYGNRLRKWSNAKNQENIKLTSKIKKINMVK